jgi:hypothetical protein
MKEVFGGGVGAKMRVFAFLGVDFSDIFWRVLVLSV